MGDLIIPKEGASPGHPVLYPAGSALSRHSSGTGNRADAQLTADVTVADMSGAYLAGTYLNLIPSGLNMSGACVTGVYHATSMSLSGKGAGNECVPETPPHSQQSVSGLR